MCCCTTIAAQINLLYCALLAVHQFTSLTHVAAALQYEISLDAYNRLTSTPDAKGRKIEVVKVPIPYPLFRTYKEADGLHVSSLFVLAVSSPVTMLCLLLYHVFRLGACYFSMCHILRLIVYNLGKKSEICCL